MHPAVRTLFRLALFAGPLVISADDLQARAEKIFRRVEESMASSHRNELALIPHVFDRSPVPHLRPGTNLVVVGVGFLEFTDRLSHAVARDEYTPGYLGSYLASCSTVGNGIAELPPWPPSPASEGRIENEQRTAFNQLAGNWISIEFAHHYLGHHEAHRKQARSVTDPGTPEAPMATTLSERNQRRAIRDGVAAAVHGGYTTEALQKVVTALGRLPERPAWSAWFFRPKSTAESLVDDLKKAQDKALSR